MKTDRWVYARPISTYYAAYIDQAKSKPYQNALGIVENLSGLPFWIPTQEFLTSFDKYLEKVGELQLVEHIVYDPFMGVPLIKFFVEEGKSGIWDGKVGNGMIAMQYTDHLMAYRKREDGLLGLESISGMVDTRLSVVEALKYPDRFPPAVKKTTKTQANFGSPDGEFSSSRVEEAQQEGLTSP